MIKKLIYSCLILIASWVLIGCGGKHVTVVNPEIVINNYHKSFIVNNNRSKARGVIIIPVPGAATGIPGEIEEVESKGNIAEVIKTELRKYGVESMIGTESNTIPDDVDFIVRYDDLWQWDLKYYLETLKIKFIGRNDGVVLAEGNYKSSYVHNFPNPREVVPKLIGDIFGSKSN